MNRQATDRSELRAERDRIRDVYRSRAETHDRVYSPAEPANLFFRQTRERHVLAALRRNKMLPLAARRTLEIGCGAGQWLVDLETWGACQTNLYGIDLDKQRLRLARGRLSHANLLFGDAAELPFPSNSFDIVVQSTVLSSVLCQTMRRQIAREMDRVCKSGGIIISYDFVYNNPGNENVRRLTRSDISLLFPGLRWSTKRITLAPPITRRLAPRFWRLALALESLSLLNTHDLTIIHPGSSM